MSDDGLLEAFFMGQSQARLKIINDVDDDRSAVVAELITTKADRDAYKILAETLLCKYGNIEDINSILADAHRKSWEAQIANYKKDTGFGLSNQTLNRTKKLSKDCVANYATEKVTPKPVEKYVEPPRKTSENQKPVLVSNLYYQF